MPPNADAGASQFVTPTSTASLSAQASADPDNGPLNLAYLWWLDSLPSSSTATLQHPNTATPQFVADKSGYYIGRVEANDGLLASFSNTLVTSAALCDADANGVVNQTDIALITAALGQTVLANDPRDFNHDGTITQADVTGCSGMLSSSGPTLQILPTSFTESLVQGGAAVMQAIQISSSGNPIDFTVSSDSTWLTASVTSGSTGSIGSLNATVSPAGLTPSTYHGVLTFTPDSGSAIAVSVTLTVNPLGLQLSPSSFTESLPQGGSAVMQSLQISYFGNPVNFTVSSNEPWLTSSVTNGNTSTTSSLNAMVNPAGLTPATYNGSLTFTPASGNVQTVPVTLTVTNPGAINANPSTLYFVMPYGGTAPPLQTVNLTAGSGAVNFTVASDSPWLTTPTTSGATPAQLNVTASPGAMAPGIYGGNLTLTAGSFTSKVAVTFTIELTGTLCDVNLDGVVNVADIQQEINEALGVLMAGNDQNKDGVVNAVDVQIEIGAVIGLGCWAH